LLGLSLQARDETEIVRRRRDEGPIVDDLEDLY
jgi:hypothetical protein